VRASATPGARALRVLGVTRWRNISCLAHASLVISRIAQPASTCDLTTCSFTTCSFTTCCFTASWSAARRCRGIEVGSAMVQLRVWRRRYPTVRFRRETLVSRVGASRRAERLRGHQETNALCASHKADDLSIIRDKVERWIPLPLVDRDVVGRLEPSPINSTATRRLMFRRNRCTAACRRFRLSIAHLFGVLLFRA
jgi:hypothetical protein